ncbi:hypothetical protein [Pseudoalteromonas denitrificans]|uniref:Uncharacterized protein n=1 Tax=Pseudoalteromonas denitrificans DSM 6059 TaxID=1123010 RepID=A0A1I1GW76_9GAMM|nr:hypothetical protein [Pseudoalteromonas denitrificans]SFC16077.1 hypothetical protein SAMN02745724_01060 [Pseudoalteromonas denitrificans DSM 6059]
MNKFLFLTSIIGLGLNLNSVEATEAFPTPHLVTSKSALFHVLSLDFNLENDEFKNIKDGLDFDISISQKIGVSLMLITLKVNKALEVDFIFNSYNKSIEF